jgi:tetratricopeptide (TPR) repeat protein
LLKRRRQKLHGRVVDVLRERFPERAAAEPELIARHAEAAGRPGEAIAAYQRAAEAAQAHSAHAESIRHLERAIALLVTRPAHRGRDACEAKLQMALAESCAVALGYTSPEVEAAHERTRALCASTGDATGLGFALSRLAAFAHNCGQAERACALAAEALAIGEQAGDAELRLKAHCDLGLAEVYRGRFVSSLGHLEAALRLQRPAARHARPSATGNPGVRALSASAWDLWVLGFPDRALARAREGVARARDLDHPFSIAHALFFETVTHALRRDAAAQQRRAEEAIALSEAEGFPFWLGVGKMFHAAARVSAGEHAAVTDLCAGLALTAGTGSRGGAPAMIVLLGEAYLSAGRLDEARAAVEGGLVASVRMGQPFFDAELHRLRGEIVLAEAGPPDDAAPAYLRALETARAQQSKSFELRAAAGLARLWGASGMRAEARGLLAPVYDWFSEGFATRDLVAARRLLDELA